MEVIDRMRWQMGMGFVDPTCSRPQVADRSDWATLDLSKNKIQVNHVKRCC